MSKEFDQKKEQIVACFERTFDKNMAYTKLGLTDKEIELLENDKEFQQRLEFRLIDKREELIDKYSEFMESDNESISFKATQEMAQVLYPDFFKNKRESGIIINNNLTDFSKFTDDQLKVIIQKGKLRNE